MGSELCMIRLSIKKGMRPHFSRAKDELSRLSALPISEWPDAFLNATGDCRMNHRRTGEDCQESCKGDWLELLEKDLEDFQQAWRCEFRDVEKFSICHKTVLQTGGMTWGDVPSESYGMIERLMSSGLTKAMGFDSTSTYSSVVLW